MPSAKHYTGAKYMNILAKQNSGRLKELSSLQRHLLLDQNAASEEAEQLKGMESSLDGFRNVLIFTRSNTTGLMLDSLICSADSSKRAAAALLNISNRRGW